MSARWSRSELWLDLLKRLQVQPRGDQWQAWITDDGQTLETESRHIGIGASPIEAIRNLQWRIWASMVRARADR